MSIKRLASDGVLTAFALIIFILEMQLPPLLPIPGVKPGLSFHHSIHGGPHESHLH